MPRTARAVCGATSERYGPWRTCYERFKRWGQDGTWTRLLEEKQVKDDSVGQAKWAFSIDPTIARAQQHAAGARKGGRRRDGEYEAKGGRRWAGPGEDWPASFT
ncbi:transposase [Microbispora sp. KK1-11]|nr:transposase [Microbispora sp. KK1-11]